MKRINVLNCICDLFYFYTYMFNLRQETPNENAIGPFDNHTFKDLYAAAQNGRRMNDCPSLYSKCSTSYKEFIKLVNI